MKTIVEKVTRSDQKIALSSIQELSKSEEDARMNNNQVITLRIGDSEEVITIPLKALVLLKSIISNMAEGKSITLVPTNEEVTTQQAADILSVSRPHVVKLLEEGKIPYKKVGSHRRVFLEDIMEYQIKAKSKRRAKLDELAKEAQDLDLGYE